GDLPECLEREPNDSPDTAQRLSWPCVVNGRIGRPGDRDYYEFEAKKGQNLVLETLAQRLGSPLDTALTIFNANGDVQAHAEDQDPGLTNAAFGRPVTTDAGLTWTAPEDGVYRILVRDLYGSQRGGPEFVYRLEIRAAAPDFRLIVVPDHRTGRTPDRQQVP